MRVLVCTHHRYAGLGVFQAPLAAGAHDIVEWVPAEDDPPPVAGFDAVISLGGRAQVANHDAHPWLRAEKDVVRAALRGAKPMLGVCLGAQVLAKVTGGAVRRAAQPEVGWHEIRRMPAAAADPVLSALPRRFPAFEWHHDEILLPPDGVAMATSATYLQAFGLRRQPAWGLQFHPEATHDDLATWLERWHTDPRAVATGLDPAAILRETAARIEHSNLLGTAIIERFLVHAQAVRRGAGHHCATTAVAAPDESR